MADIDLPVFPFRANWREPFVERLSFLTDVRRAAQGAEQRARLRRTPRRSYEADFLLSGPERTFYDLFMNRRAGEEITAPLYWDVVRLSAATVAGSTVRLNFSTAYREFQIGGLALLLGNTALDHEVVEIDGLDANGIDLVSATVRAWPKGTLLVPLRRAVIDDASDFTHYSGGTATASVQIRFTAANPWTPAADDSPIYDGLPVFLSEPNWVEPLKAAYERQYTSLDNNVGLPYQVDSLGRALIGQSHRWFLPGRESMAAFRDLLYRHEGRAGSFWLPTFKHDLRLAASAFAVATQIEVENVGYALTGGPVGGREHIAIKHDGGTIIRRVLDVSAGSTLATETLELDAALGLDLSPGQVHRISFAGVSRFDQDDFEIVHHGGPENLHECNAMFRAIKNTRDPSGTIYYPIPTSAMTAGSCGQALTVFNGLSWLLPCLGSVSTNVCSCAATQSDSYAVGGDPGTVYDVVFRVRGIVEEVSYSGGTAYGTTGNVQKDATGHSPSNYNVYRLDVSDPPASYFLNNGTTDTTAAEAVDYEVEIPIRGGATITLYANSVDTREIKNRLNRTVADDDPAFPVVVAQPYNGQFMQIDGTLPI